MLGNVRRCASGTEKKSRDGRKRGSALLFVVKEEGMAVCLETYAAAQTAREKAPGRQKDDDAAEPLKLRKADGMLDTVHCL